MDWTDVFSANAWMRAVPPLAVAAVVAGGVGLGIRSLITSAVESAVRRRSEKDMETFRAELRQALLDKRRIEAAEQLWASVGDLGPFKGLASTLAVLKIPEVSRLASTEPKMRQMMTGLLAGTTPEMLTRTNKVADERPFLSPLAWAYYSAYSMLIGFYFYYGKLTEKLYAIKTLASPGFGRRSAAR